MAGEVRAGFHPSLSFGGSSPQAASEWTCPDTDCVLIGLERRRSGRGRPGSQAGLFRSVVGACAGAIRLGGRRGAREGRGDPGWPGCHKRRRGPPTQPNSRPRSWPGGPPPAPGPPACVAAQCNLFLACVIFRHGQVRQGPVCTMSESASHNGYEMRPRRIRWTLSGLRFTGRPFLFKLPRQALLGDCTVSPEAGADNHLLLRCEGSDPGWFSVRSSRKFSPSGAFRERTTASPKKG
jgi:hypothetical protein